MADKRITSRTKVYITRIGLKDWLVAASSQKAALAAWDVHRNLFAEGSARITNDPGDPKNFAGPPTVVVTERSLAQAACQKEQAQQRDRGSPRVSSANPA